MEDYKVNPVTSILSNMKLKRNGKIAGSQEKVDDKESLSLKKRNSFFHERKK